MDTKRIFSNWICTKEKQKCSDWKQVIRKDMKSMRSSLQKEEIAQKSCLAADIFLKNEIYTSAKTIMLYIPLGKEIDTSEIVRKAREDGKKIVLPVTDEKTGIIKPYFYEEDTVLEKGGFSVAEPRNTMIVSKEEIDTVLVPGIAFDRFGSRIGFGKGCYDMFLENMQAIKVGYAYDFQLCEKIPEDEHDIKMDFIVTEKEVIKCIPPEK